MSQVRKAIKQWGQRVAAVGTGLGLVTLYYGLLNHPVWLVVAILLWTGPATSFLLKLVPGPKRVLAGASVFAVFLGGVALSSVVVPHRPADTNHQELEHALHSCERAVDVLEDVFKQLAPAPSSPPLGAPPPSGGASTQHGPTTRPARGVRVPGEQRTNIPTVLAEELQHSGVPDPDSDPPPAVEGPVDSIPPDGPETDPEPTTAPDPIPPSVPVQPPAGTEPRPIPTPPSLAEPSADDSPL